MRLGAWVGICAALVNACSPGPLTSASEVGSISRHAPDALVTSEAGGSLVITFQLDDLPSADVQIEVTTTDPTEALTQPSTLIFATNNYSTPQEITVIGQDDPTDDGDADYALQFRVVSDDTRYAAVTIEDMSLSNVDDDTAGVTLTPSDGLRTHELGASDTFAVVLDTPPTRDVTVELDSSDKAEGTVAPNSVRFTPDNWDVAQMVTITGVADANANGDAEYEVEAHVVSFDSAYDAVATDSVRVTNEDFEVTNISESNGGPSSHPRLSANGRIVVYETDDVFGALDENGTTDVVHFDRDHRKSTLLSRMLGGRESEAADGRSWAPDISGDGSKVVFLSTASELSEGLHNGHYAIGTVSYGADTIAPRIALDGGRVVYSFHDPESMTGSIHVSGLGTANRNIYGGVMLFPTVSNDGARIAFEATSSYFVDDDTNGVADVFVHGTAGSEEFVRASVGPNGEANGASIRASLSSDGRSVAFISEATNLGQTPTGRYGLYWRDLDSEETFPIASRVGYGTPAISGDGKFVAYVVDGHVYVHDRVKVLTRRVDLKVDGSAVPGASKHVAISDDGTHVAFASEAELVPDDSNGFSDVYTVKLNEGFWRSPCAPNRCAP